MARNSIEQFWAELEEWRVGLFHSPNSAVTPKKAKVDERLQTATYNTQIAQRVMDKYGHDQDAVLKERARQGGPDVDENGVVQRIPVPVEPQFSTPGHRERDSRINEYHSEAAEERHEFPEFVRKLPPHPASTTLSVRDCSAWTTFMCPPMIWRDPVWYPGRTKDIDRWKGAFAMRCVRENPNPFEDHMDDLRRCFAYIGGAFTSCGFVYGNYIWMQAKEQGKYPHGYGPRKYWFAHVGIHTFRWFIHAMLWTVFYFTADRCMMDLRRRIAVQQGAVFTRLNDVERTPLNYSIGFGAVASSMVLSDVMRPQPFYRNFLQLTAAGMLFGYVLGYAKCGYEAVMKQDRRDKGAWDAFTKARNRDKQVYYAVW